MRKIGIALVVLLLLGAGLWWFKGREDGSVPKAPGVAGSALEADAPLAFVPADTPYLIANLERMPKATVDAFLQQSEPILQLWGNQMDLVNQRLDQDEEARAAAKWLRALGEEFKGKKAADVIAAFGLDPQSLSAVYGIGLVPVARMTLADPAAFRAVVARLEQRTGETIPTGRIDDIDYWQLTSPEAPVRGIFALQGQHLVATLAPVGDDSALRTLLGIERPANALRDGGALAAINAKYGYVPYATGYVDSARVVALLTAPATPLETAFLTALKIEKPAVDAVCQAEYAAIATVAPRLVIGYTVLEPKQSIAISRIELRSDVAQDLMTLRAPMPGLAAADGSVFNVGVALRAGAVPTLANKWADAAAAAPWQCSSLASLNQAFVDLRQQAANPAVFMVAPAINAFHAILTRIDVASLDTTPDLAGKLLLGSPNPAALLGMAKSFAPQIGELKLEPGGDVQPLPAMPGLPTNLPTHAVMDDGLLGLSFGTGEETTLKAALQVDATQQPLLVIGYSGAAFSQFMEKSMGATNASIQDPAARAEAEQSLKMVRDMYALIRHIGMRVDFDEHGVAVQQVSAMN